MKAFVINPWNETITEVDDNFGNDHRRIYRHLSEPNINDVNTFDSVALSDVGDVVYVDDEGMLSAGIPCFTFRFSSVPLAGRGVVLGTDDEGETVQPSKNVTLEWLNREVVWLRLVTTGEFGPSSQAMIDHPTFGKVWNIRAGMPVLDYPPEKKDR